MQALGRQLARWRSTYSSSSPAWDRLTQATQRNFSDSARGSLTDPGAKKIVAVLYQGGEAAERQPRLLGTVENALGLRPWLEGQGHTLIATASKEPLGSSELDKHLGDADVVITTPFHPGYLTPERLQAAPKLKLALTAGVGSDHVDLPTAAELGITVAEVTGCNVVSVAEHVVMQMLALVRNYMPAYKQVLDGKWDIAAIAEQAYDLEGKVVGTVGCGRIGQRVLQRLQGFGCAELLYTDYARMAPEREAQLNATYTDLPDLVRRCDVVTINMPLHKNTDRLFNKDLIATMKRGAYLVNTARGRIADTDAVVEALESGQLGGYAGDVWFPQPAPADHPWRRMPRHAMTPHYSGTTLDAQERYAAGVRDILQRSFQGRALNPADVIVQGGELAPQYNQAAKNRSLDFAAGWERPMPGMRAK